MGEEVHWCEGHVWHCQTALGSPVNGTKKVQLDSYSRERLMVLQAALLSARSKCLCNFVTSGNRVE